jgi:hypothetical protein
MKIQTPFQIVHPLEYYEDRYRKAVAPEWEIRLQNVDLLQSKTKESIKPMFEGISKEK